MRKRRTLHLLRSYFVLTYSTQVRELAEKYQLPTRARKDSQGICFLGKLKFDEFIEHYLGENEGPIRCYRTGTNSLHCVFSNLRFQCFVRCGNV